MDHPLQLEEGSRRFVLLPSAMLGPQLRGSHQIIFRLILFLLGIQAEQPSPLLHQDEALRQPQDVHRLFLESARQSTQLQRSHIRSRIHQWAMGHLPAI